MRQDTRVLPVEIRPMRSLGLLSVAHAINHAQAVILPLIFLALIDEFRVGVQDDRLPGRDRRVRRRDGPAELRRPDPGRLASAAAGVRRDPVRGRVRRAGARDELPDLRHPEHRVADRLVAAAPGRQRPARRAVPARAPRVRDQRPHRRRQRRDGRRRGHRRAAHRGRRLARRVDRLRHPGDRRRDPDPAVRPRARDGPGRSAGQRDRPGGVRPDPARPRPALAVPDLGAGRRRARPRRRQPVRAPLPDPGHRHRRGDGRADVRGAHRLLGADAARRRLAVGPDRAQAAHRRASISAARSGSSSSCWPARRSSGCGPGSC